MRIFAIDPVHASHRPFNSPGYQSALEMKAVTLASVVLCPRCGECIKGSALGREEKMPGSPSLGSAEEAVSWLRTT